MTTATPLFARNSPEAVLSASLLPHLERIATAAARLESARQACLRADADPPFVGDEDSEDDVDADSYIADVGVDFPDTDPATFWSPTPHLSLRGLFLHRRDTAHQRLFMVPAQQAFGDLIAALGAVAPTFSSPWAHLSLHLDPSGTAPSVDSTDAPDAPMVHRVYLYGTALGRLNPQGGLQAVADSLASLAYDLAPCACPTGYWLHDPSTPPIAAASALESYFVASAVASATRVRFPSWLARFDQNELLSVGRMDTPAETQQAIARLVAAFA